MDGIYIHTYIYNCNGKADTLEDTKGAGKGGNKGEGKAGGES